MSNNVSAVMDESYNYSMWVEVYNSGNTSLNLSSYYFSDDATNYKKWQPDSQTLAAKRFAVLWFERDDRAGHASFKLSPEGGALYLSDAAGNVIDQVFYPQQYRNVSYGRTTDGVGAWAFFYQYTLGVGNAAGKSATARCKNPVFTLPGGFYPMGGGNYIDFYTPEAGDTIYFTRDGSEPTRNSMPHTAAHKLLASTCVVRARTFSANKLPSDVVTQTYFYNERDFHLPVVSIATDTKFLTDDSIGIYTVGVNGIPYPGLSAANYFQDWDRPANFELYDTTKTARLNQELDIAISGGWTRNFGQKSLKISPRKKFGDNRLRYDIFAATKPNKKYKDIQIRNSGNDFQNSMMRDAFMQSLIMHRLDVDYQAYEPAVCFINGVYYGIQNLRERTSKDYLYTNYGLDEDEFYLLQQNVQTDETSASPFLELSQYVNANSPAVASVYAQIETMVDVDELINYYITQIYVANTDWHNNLKTWKKKTDGKWRWILFDTDFGFGLSGQYNTNNLQNDVIYNSHNVPSTTLFNRLLLNADFKSKFINRFYVQIASTFEPNRVIQVMDSLADKIRNEISYHKAKWGGQNFETELNTMKDFANQRPAKMIEFLGSQFFNSTATYPVNISSNIPNATYTFNAEPVLDNNVSIKYPRNQSVVVSANEPEGYRFQHWLRSGSSASVQSLVARESVWKYWDDNRIPATNWYAAAYSDAAWKSGKARLGYGSLTTATQLNYGSDANNKYPTAYFRQTVNISDLANKTNFSLDLYVDDGAAVYINGVEAARYLLPTGALSFDTYATTYHDCETAVTFAIDKSLLKEGANLIAVEVHQHEGKSSDLYFDMSLTYSVLNSSSNIELNREYATQLSGSLILQAIYEPTGVAIPSVFPEQLTPLPQIYPTQTTNFITVEYAAGQVLTIYDLSGKRLLQQRCHSNKEIFPLQGLARGIYIASVGGKAFKLVKSE